MESFAVACNGFEPYAPTGAIAAPAGRAEGRPGRLKQPWCLSRTLFPGTANCRSSFAFPAFCRFHPCAPIAHDLMPIPVRSVAQPGSALDWGSWGRGFESRRSDQSPKCLMTGYLPFCVVVIRLRASPRPDGVPVSWVPASKKRTPCPSVRLGVTARPAVLRRARIELWTSSSRRRARSCR